MATYSFLDVQAAIVGVGGSFALGADAGVAEEGITVEMTEDKDTMVIGADGNVQHNLHAGNSGRIVIRYLKTSPTNQMLQQMYAAQQGSAANWGQNVITVHDPALGDDITGTDAAFARFPTIVYAKEGPMNEWSFLVGKLVQVLGNGAPVTGL